ncbi:MAG: NAD-dependent epimerase/dehydratase family protein [Methanobacteriota archaeon]
MFITGGAGFIGSALVERLVSKNRVIVYDDLSRDALSSGPIAKHPNLRIVEGDVLDLRRLREGIRGSTIVIHCAGITGVDTVIRNPVRTMKVNMLGSVNVLDAALDLEDCKRVVCFSTSEVFGSFAYRSAESSPAVLGVAGEARLTYAVSKLAEEHAASSYFKEHGLPTVIIRPFNVYGPGQVGEGALRTFILRALKGQPLQIHGDGTQIRAWCYIDDTVDGVLLTLVKEDVVGESFNIGNQRTVVTIYGLANTVIRVLGSRSAIEFVPRPSADIELRVPSVDKAERVLGFRAKVDLEEGIRRTAEYFKRSL